MNNHEELRAALTRAEGEGREADASVLRKRLDKMTADAGHPMPHELHTSEAVRSVIADLESRGQFDAAAGYKSRLVVLASGAPTATAVQDAAAARTRETAEIKQQIAAHEAKGDFAKAAPLKSRLLELHRSK